MATGRDELLKKNQQKVKKKRKSLMDVLSEYQQEKGYGPKKSKNIGMTGIGPVKDGKAYARGVNSTKLSIGKRASGGHTSRHNVKTAAAPKASPKSSSGNRLNSPVVKRTDGLVGENVPSNPKLKSQPKTTERRRRRPGTGRRGEAAAKRANRSSGRTRQAQRRSLTPAQRRALRRASGRRRG